MKKIILSLLFIIVSILAASGQTFNWAYSAGSQYYPDMGQVIRVDSQGNTYVSGFFNGTVQFDPNSDDYTFTAPNPPFGREYFLEKFDAGGNFLWVKVFNDSGAFSDAVFEIDSQDNIYFSSTFSGTVDINPGDGQDLRTTYANSNAFIIKLNSNGDYIYGKTFEFYNDAYVTSTAITIDSAGDIVLAGEFYGIVDFDFSLAEKIIVGTQYFANNYIMKMSSDGEFIWVKNFTEAFFRTIKTDSQNNIIAGGGQRGAVDMNPGVGIFMLDSHNYNTVNLFVLKLDTDGNFAWVKSAQDRSDPTEINTYYDEAITSVAIDNEDNIYFTGSFMNFIDFSSGGVNHVLETQNDIYDSNAFLGKYNAEGDLLWIKLMEGNNTTHSASNSSGSSLTNVLTIANDGSLYHGFTFTGTYNYTINGVANTVTNNMYGIAFMVVDKNNGNLESIYYTTSTESNNLHLWDMSTHDNYLYATGFFTDTFTLNEAITLTSLEYQPDVFAIKFSPVTLGNESVVKSENMVYPNPAKDVLTINTSAFPLQHVSIFDVAGKTIKEIKVNNVDLTTVDVSDLSKGIYLVKLTSNKATTVKKIIIK
jgi:hypothetical protein